MNTSHKNDRSFRARLLGNPVVALALGLLLFSTTAGARSTDTRAEDPLIGSKGDAASAPGATISPVTLPIEVLGPDGYTASVTVDVPSLGEVSELYLRIHSPVYRDVSVNPGRGPKASVRLNDGAWLGISNQTVDVFEHEAEYGGLNGSYHTVRMTIPISALGTPQAGSNTLSFRFNGTDGHTLGYRVIELNLLRAGGSEILPSNSFVQDAPEQWMPITDNPADIDAGEDLWRNASLRDFPGGPQIQASCADCHMQDGRDLWYFAFSNKSIVERSKFHGLSQNEAEKIASYIRSLQDNDPLYAVDPPGRPWNPPFQPGPGLDALPARTWAAGAGIDAVLERDEDTVADAFGPTIEASDLDFSNPDLPAFNMRETRLAIQFPDWNEWVTDEYPRDIWPGFESTNMYQTYVALRNDLDTQGAEALLNAGGSNRIDQRIDALVDTVDDFIRDNVNNQGPGSQEQDRRRALRHWLLVKVFEIMLDGDFYDDPPTLFGSYGEVRGGIAGERVIFDMAPHLSGAGGNRFTWTNQVAAEYFSTSWYQVQQTVNSGHTVNTGNVKPVDWNYQPRFVFALAEEGGPKHPIRQLLTWTKNMQLFYDYDADSNSDAYSIRWRQVHPARFNPRGKVIWNDINVDTLGMVYDAILDNFMDRLDSLPGGTSAWDNVRRNVDTDCNTNGNQEKLLKPATFDGDGDGGNCDSWGDESLNTQIHRITAHGEHAQGWYWMILAYRDVGVSEYTLNRLIDWGQDIWPNGSWETLRVDPNPDPPDNPDDPEVYILQLQSGWNTVALPVAPDNPNMAQLVDGLESLTMVKDIGGGVYLPDLGIHTLTTWETTKAYKVLVDGNAILNVSGTPLQPAQTPIPLQAGWNLLPYFLDSPRSVEEALAPILDRVQYLTDEENGIYDPETGTNTIGMLDPGHGYLVYLDQSATLIYPSN